MQLTEPTTTYTPNSPPTTPMPPGPQYEFTTDQNLSIGGLASAMNFVGAVTIGLGALMLFAVLRGDAHLAVIGAVQVVIGVWTLSAAAAFRRIVDTRGSDIDHLMTAVDRLASVYRLQQVLIIAAIAVLVAAVIVTFALPGVTPPATVSPP